MNVKIYKPAKNAMQSGRAKDAWVLEYDAKINNAVDPLMGWTSSDSTASQVKLNFTSKDEALAYAEKKGWNAIIAKENIRRVKPKNYGDNFKYVE